MKNKILLLTIALFCFSGCGEDFLDTVPEETISQEQLAANPAAFQAIVNGMYASIRTFGVGGTTRHVDYGHMGILAGLDMMSHDVTQSIFHWYGFFYNYDGRTQDASRTLIIWTTYYSLIAEANSVINGIDPNTTDEAARHLLGQALAIKGISLLQLARVYGDTYIGNESAAGIPLPDGTNFDGDSRAPLSEVYALITADLESAVSLLEGFARSSKQEVDQSVAQGFLARTYLETGEWAKAAQTAADARANYALMSAEEWQGGFSDISNGEWMWGSDIDSESSTVFASFFSHFDNTIGGYAGAIGVYKLIDAKLYGQISDTDTRKSAFVDPVNLNPTFPDLPAYANTKFRDATFFEGDYVYMRAAEMYLIEAEAKARIGDASAAQVLFDLVSTRDPGYTLSASTGDALVQEVYLQRRIELWGEGFAWFDLKRLGLPLERDYEGTNHASFGLFNFEPTDNKFRWQLPQDEINANDAISTSDQNPN